MSEVGIVTLRTRLRQNVNTGVAMLRHFNLRRIAAQKQKAAVKAAHRDNP